MKYFSRFIACFMLALTSCAQPVGDLFDQDQHAQARIIETVWDATSVAAGAASLADNVRRGNWGEAAVDAVGVVIDTAAALTPGVPGGVGALRAASRAADAASTARRAPDFIVDRGGQAFPVPQGAVGPVQTNNGRGTAFVDGSGGTNRQVDTIRIMDPTPPNGRSPGYPDGYVRYQNDNRPTPQAVNPYTGRTVSRAEGHYPLRNN
jgi:hypothetical protein